MTYNEYRAPLEYTDTRASVPFLDPVGYDGQFPFEQLDNNTERTALVSGIPPNLRAVGDRWGGGVA